MRTEKNQILFISSYPPRECGIATFTQDLVNAMERLFNESFAIKVCAINEDSQQTRNYPAEVIMELNANSRDNYRQNAEEINNNEGIVAVVIEHEFGLFTGTYGDYLFSFLDAVSKPVFICFHTVLEKPDDTLLEIVSGLSEKVEAIIVLTEHSKNILQSDYDIPAAHINIIPHGVHLLKPITDKTAVKDKYGFSGKIILGTFGLISSNKGIETALDAIARLPDRSNILYLVMGKTHPCVYREEGEQYREFLMKKTVDLGIEENVLFINKYLELRELLTYLKLIDIYIFTSKNPRQTASGTLSYAMGSGCTVVSTTIPHAIESLKDGAGFLFDFGNSNELKDIIEMLLQDPEKLKTTSLAASKKARNNAWENIANLHARLIESHVHEKVDLTYNLPPLLLEHFCRLTTTNGIVQFSIMCDPDLKSGYTTDDNARAIYVLTLYNELYPNDTYLSKYLSVFLGFLQKAVTSNGSFLNYMNQEGEFTMQNHEENLEEANSRAFMALCRLVQSPAVGVSQKETALQMIRSFRKYIYTVKSPRSIAKLIKGLYFLNQYKKEAANTAEIHNLAYDLMRMYKASASSKWDWFEPYLTYNNSTIPEGLMYAYLATNESAYRKIAERTFDFLISNIFAGDRIRVISNKLWMKKEESYIHQFGEQPVEIASTIEALYIFYQGTAEEKYGSLMRTAFSWFLGNNHLGQIIYNPVNGGCHDGLEENEVNMNQGAESTLSYMVSRLTMDKLMREKYVLDELLSLGLSKQTSQR